MIRMWVNQPSTLQPHHSLHGECVLAEDEGGETTRVWFTHGVVISMQIPNTALSQGWPRLNQSDDAYKLLGPCKVALDLIDVALSDKGTEPGARIAAAWKVAQEALALFNTSNTPPMMKCGPHRQRS